jgi:hypothetical protein
LCVFVGWVVGVSVCLRVRVHVSVPASYNSPHGQADKLRCFVLSGPHDLPIEPRPWPLPAPRSRPLPARRHRALKRPGLPAQAFRAGRGWAGTPQLGGTGNQRQHGLLRTGPACSASRFASHCVCATVPRSLGALSCLGVAHNAGLHLILQEPGFQAGGRVARERKNRRPTPSPHPRDLTGCRFDACWPAQAVLVAAASRRQLSPQGLAGARLTRE